jgi:hypothetical protein
MTVSQKQSWIAAYYFYQSLSSQISSALSADQLGAALLEAVNLVQSQMNKSYSAQWQQYATYAIGKLGVSWNVSYFTEKVDNYTTGIVRCDECVSTYYLDSSTKSCLPCNKACRVCTNASQCLLCTEDYPAIIDANGGGVCYVCAVVGCQTCSNTNVCSQCQVGHTLVNGQCVYCSGDCLTCDSTATTCSLCLASKFSLSSNQGSCFTCADPYCRSCDPTNTTICWYCGYGLAPVNGICTQCQPNCLVCANATSCTQCAGGFGLVNQICKLCSPGCKNCDTNST